MKELQPLVHMFD